jgi:ABC-type transport system involved in multi-copper enzyme maturation permease subunit
LKANPEKTTRLWNLKGIRRKANPILWKECNFEGLAPLAWFQKWPRWWGILAVVFGTWAFALWQFATELPPIYSREQVIGMILILDFQSLKEIWEDTGLGRHFLQFHLVVFLVCSFVVAIRSSGTITGEKEKGTWEALLVTPLSDRQIVIGKLLGILKAFSIYWLAFAIAFGIPSWILGALVFYQTMTIHVAIFLAVLFVASTGLWCSARSKNSWRSLVGTLGVCYFGALALQCPLSFIFFTIFGTFYYFVELIAIPTIWSATGLIQLITITVLSSAIFGLLLFNKFLIHGAIYWVGKDRTKSFKFPYHFLYRGLLDPRNKPPEPPEEFEKIPYLFSEEDSDPDLQQKIV